jgi:hypothetical protein
MDGDVVQLDVRVLERPLGDPFINQELWQHTDEMVVPFDRKTAVEDNGFRVGQIVGITPVKLQDHLSSERYCVSPRRHVVPSGQSITLYLTSAKDARDYVIQTPNPTLEETAGRARFGLEVRATLSDDGNTRLSFTPKVESGEAALPFHAAPDQQAWAMREGKPFRSYPDVAWEVVLAPGKFLVIGAIPQKEKSLGQRAFIQEDGAGAQRLLVLCTSRSAGERVADRGGETASEELVRRQPSPCLAVQASRSAVRGSGE